MRLPEPSLLALPVSSLAALALAAAPGPASAQGAATTPTDAPVAWRAPWFVDASEELGLLFKHADGAFAYAMGSGCGWLDMELDGDEDLVVLSAVGSCALFRNDGDVFVDVADTSGIVLLHGNDPIGVAIADWDQDGLRDLYFCNTNVNQLFHNVGGTFVDRTLELGVHGGGRWSSSASWADFDLDGDLDLYVGNYVDDLNFPYHYGWPNQLFENRGPGASPVFEDVAPALGVDGATTFGPTVPDYPYPSPEGQPTAGCTLSVSTIDHDEDGDPDLMVGNDFGLFVDTNRFYRNDTAGGAMAFTDVTSETGFDIRPHYNMGIAPRDYDHDGDWDYYCSNLGDNVLLRNDGGVFVDATYEAGPVSGENADGSALLSSWGTMWEDLDNDGHEDLLVVNGLIPATTFIYNDPRSPNHLWRNNGDGTFGFVPGGAFGADDRGPGRAIAPLDLDSDGLLDFYLQNNGASGVAKLTDRSRFYRGAHPGPTGRWLELDLAGRVSNLEAIGARVDATVGGTVLKRQVLADGLFLASPSRMVHFGLGRVAAVDRLTVHWPSGIVQELLEVEPDRRLALLEPAATVGQVLPPSWTGTRLVVQAEVDGHDVVSHDGAVAFEVRLPDGTVLGQGAWSGTLPAAGGVVTASVALPVDPAEYALLAGTPADVLVRATASGAEDADLAAVLLP